MARVGAGVELTRGLHAAQVPRTVARMGNNRTRLPTSLRRRGGASAQEVRDSAPQRAQLPLPETQHTFSPFKKSSNSNSRPRTSLSRFRCAASKISGAQRVNHRGALRHGAKGGRGHFLRMPEAAVLHARKRPSPVHTLSLLGMAAAYPHTLMY